MAENKDQPKPEVDTVVSEQELMQKFYEEYTNLCKKHKFTIVVTPTFKATNHGSWEMILQSSVGKLQG